MSVLIGNRIEVPLTITDTVTGDPVDPSTLEAVVTAPDGTETTYTYPSANLSRESAGSYLLAWDGNDDGRWFWRTIATGLGAGEGDGWVDVRPLYSQPDDQITTYYATVQDLRDHLGVADDVLSDRAVAALIRDAEDLIDEDLGARRISKTTGRKVVQADVEVWRFTKLARATVKLAALLHTKPDTLDQQYSKVTGPDFSFEGPIGSRFGSSVDPLLNQSGLRRLTTHIAHCRDRPAWDDFVYNRDYEY